MPGLMDLLGLGGGSSQPGYGLLGALGLPSPGIAASVNPQLQQSEWQRQGYNSLAQDPNFGPGNAALAMTNPGALQAKIFQDQLQSLMQANPGMSYPEALYKLSEGGQKEQFGRTEGQPLELPSGTKVPTVYQGPNLQWAVPGFGGNAVGTGQTSSPPTAQRGTAAPIATGGQGGLGGSKGNPLSALQPLIDSAQGIEKGSEAAKAEGQEQGATNAHLEASVGAVDRSIQQIDELAADKKGEYYSTGGWSNLPVVAGKPDWLPGPSVKWVSGVEQLKHQLTFDLLPTLNKGRMSPALLDNLEKATAGFELDRANPDFDSGLQKTRDALVQIRTAMQHGAGQEATPAPQPESAAFSSPADVRAAIKAGKLKVGQPFKTSDGRTLIAR